MFLCLPVPGFTYVVCLLDVFNHLGGGIFVSVRAWVYVSVCLPNVNNHLGGGIFMSACGWVYVFCLPPGAYTICRFFCACMCLVLRMMSASWDYLITWVVVFVPVCAWTYVSFSWTFISVTHVNVGDKSACAVFKECTTNKERYVSQ